VTVILILKTEPIVYAVYTFLKQLQTQATKASTSVFKDVSQSQIITSEVCGLSRFTIQGIYEEGKSLSFHSPLKKKQKII
jgi:hypothetical protein